MSSLWLVDIENPLLTEAALARIDDQERPDRLTWNTFQTLALWDPDVWVPRFVEVACGEGNALEALEWSGSSIRPWGTSLSYSGAVDVVIDGPEALILAVATLDPDPPVDRLRAAAIEALGDSVSADRLVGFVVVVPPGTPDLGPWLESAAEDQSGDGTFELLAGSSGWLTWHELGELALDVAEESDELRGEAVHQLVSEIQAHFPADDL